MARLGGLWTVDRGPWTVDCGLWTVDRLRLHGRQSHDLRLEAAEIARSGRFLVFHDTQACEDLWELIAVEDHAAANRPRLRRVAMEPFDDHHAAGTKGLSDVCDILARADVAEDNKVPLVDAPVEVLCTSDGRRDLHAQRACLFLSGRHG